MEEGFVPEGAEKFRVKKDQQRNPGSRGEKTAEGARVKAEQPQQAERGNRPEAARVVNLADRRAAVNGKKDGIAAPQGGDVVDFGKAKREAEAAKQQGIFGPDRRVRPQVRGRAA